MTSLPVLPCQCVGTKPALRFKSEQSNFVNSRYYTLSHALLHNTEDYEESKGGICATASLVTLTASYAINVLVYQNHVSLVQADAMTCLDESKETLLSSAWMQRQYRFSEPIYDAVIADFQSCQKDPRQARTSMSKDSIEVSTNISIAFDNGLEQPTFWNSVLCVLSKHNCIHLFSTEGDVSPINLPFHATKIFPIKLYAHVLYKQSKLKQMFAGLLVQRQIETRQWRKESCASENGLNLYLLTDLHGPLRKIQWFADSIDQDILQSQSDTIDILDVICVDSKNLKATLLLCIDSEMLRVELFQLEHQTCNKLSDATLPIGENDMSEPVMQVKRTHLWSLSCGARNNSKGVDVAIKSFVCIGKNTDRVNHFPEFLVFYLMDVHAGQLHIQIFEYNEGRTLIPTGNVTTIPCQDAVPNSRPFLGSGFIDDVILHTMSNELILYHLDQPICLIHHDGPINGLQVSFNQCFELVTFDSGQVKVLQILHPLFAHKCKAASSLWNQMWEVLEYVLPPLTFLKLKASVLEGIYKNPHSSASGASHNDTELLVFAKYVKEMACHAFSTGKPITIAPVGIKVSSAFERMCASTFHREYQQRHPSLFQKGSYITNCGPLIDTLDTPSMESTGCPRFRPQLYWTCDNVTLIFESMHLLLEDLRLRIGGSSCIEQSQLAFVLETLAAQLKCRDYEQYYHLCRPTQKPKKTMTATVPTPTINLFQIGEDDTVRRPSQCKTSQPDIFAWVNEKLRRSERHAYSFPSLADIRDKNARSLYSFRPSKKSPLWRTEVVVWIYKNLGSALKKSGGRAKCSDAYASIVTFLATDKVGMRFSLYDIPYGLAAPIFDIVRHVQTSPPIFLTDEVCQYLDRKDLILHEHSKAVYPYPKVDCGYEMAREERELRYDADVDTSDGLDDVVAWGYLLFPRDRRLKEVVRLLRSSRPASIKLEPSADSTGQSGQQEQQARILLQCKRAMSLSVARGMVTLGAYRNRESASMNERISVVTEHIKMPPLPLAGRIPPSNAIIHLDISMYAKELTYWPQFHNGCASGLRIASQETIPTVTRHWIRYHRPRPGDFGTRQPTQNEASKVFRNNLNEAYVAHAGFLYGLGLQGHLHCLSMADVYSYLSLSNEWITIGILLGMAVTAAKARKDRQNSKLEKNYKTTARSNMTKTWEESEDCSRLIDHEFEMQHYLDGKSHGHDGDDPASAISTEFGTLGRNEKAKCVALIGVGTGLELTLERSVSKMLCLHVPALLSAPHAEFSVPVATQAAALLGLGILYQGSGQRLMTETLFAEITRSPWSSQFTSLNVGSTGVSSSCFEQLEGYSLAAGFALGLILLGRGHVTAGDPGLTDLNLEEKLYQYIVGNAKQKVMLDTHSQYPISGCLHRGRRWKPIGSTVSSRRAQNMQNIDSVTKAESDRSDFGALKNSARQEVLEYIDVNITAPGSVFALSFMYMKTQNNSIAEKIAVPSTLSLLSGVRPDILMIRTIGKYLVLWDHIRPSREWILHEAVPTQLRLAYERVTSKYPEEFVTSFTKRLDVQLVCVAFANIVAGACMSIGFRYAGTSNSSARETLIYYFRHFKALRGPSISRNEVIATDRVTIERCLCLCGQSLALIDAGTGNVETLKLLRSINFRQHIEPALTYGNHMASSMALGLLFLGGGKATISRSHDAIAALAISLFPIYPMNTADNKYHHQAFRHFYVLAVDGNRFVETVDVDDSVSKSVSMLLQLRDENEDFGRAVEAENWLKYQSPCILPEIDVIRRIKIVSQDYFPVDILIPRNFRIMCRLSKQSKALRDLNHTRIVNLYTKNRILLKRVKTLNMNWNAHCPLPPSKYEYCKDYTSYIASIYKRRVQVGVPHNKFAKDPVSAAWSTHCGRDLINQSQAFVRTSKPLFAIFLNAIHTLYRLHTLAHISTDESWNLTTLHTYLLLNASSDDRILDVETNLKLKIDSALCAQWQTRTHQLYVQAITVTNCHPYSSFASILEFLHELRNAYPSTFYQLQVYFGGPQTESAYVAEWHQLRQLHETRKINTIQDLAQQEQIPNFWQNLITFFLSIKCNQ